MTVPVVFANLPTGRNPLALFDQMFNYVIGLIVFPNAFQPLVVTGPAVVVDATTGAIVFNRGAGGAVSVTLPTVASRNGAPLSIADWQGNCTITVTPNGAETIMGLANATMASGGQGLGTGTSVRLLPSTELSGWYQG